MPHKRKNFPTLLIQDESVLVNLKLRDGRTLVYSGEKFGWSDPVDRGPCNFCRRWILKGALTLQKPQNNLAAN